MTSRLSEFLRPHLGESLLPETARPREAKLEPQERDRHRRVELEERIEHRQSLPRLQMMRPQHLHRRPRAVAVQLLPNQETPILVESPHADVYKIERRLGDVEKLQLEAQELPVAGALHVDRVRTDLDGDRGGLGGGRCGEQRQKGDQGEEGGSEGRSPS